MSASSEITLSSGRDHFLDGHHGVVCLGPLIMHDLQILEAEDPAFKELAQLFMPPHVEWLAIRSEHADEETVVGVLAQQTSDVL